MLPPGNRRIQSAPKGSYSVSTDEVDLHPHDNSKDATLDIMIAEYQVFHDRLIQGLKKLRDQELAADGNANGRTPKGDDETVAV